MDTELQVVGVADQQVDVVVEDPGLEEEPRVDVVEGLPQQVSALPKREQVLLTPVHDPHPSTSDDPSREEHSFRVGGPRCRTPRLPGVGWDPSPDLAPGRGGNHPPQR